MMKLLDQFDDLVDTSSVERPPKIYYIYSIFQKKFLDHKDKAIFIEGWKDPRVHPDELRKQTNLMIFVDDTVEQMNPEFLRSIFIQESHHRNWY